MQATLDFEMTEYHDWDVPGTDNDAHLVLRETPAAKVREHWAEIRLREHEMTLDRDLAVAHITEHLDRSLDAPVPTHNKPTTWWQDAWDKIGVYVCRFLHSTPNYRRGDQFSQCPTCKRKYAIPFADDAKLPSDVYVASTAFPASAFTNQVKCKNGWMGEV
jgi:hypothetical protein